MIFENRDVRGSAVVAVTGRDMRRVKKEKCVFGPFSLFARTCLHPNMCMCVEAPGDEGSKIIFALICDRPAIGNHFQGVVFWDFKISR